MLINISSKQESEKVMKELKTNLLKVIPVALAFCISCCGSAKKTNDDLAPAAKYATEPASQFGSHYEQEFPVKLPDGTIPTKVLLESGDTRCPYMGYEIYTGFDNNNNGFLDPDEVNEITALVCDEISALEYALNHESMEATHCEQFINRLMAFEHVEEKLICTCVENSVWCYVEEA